MRLWSLHPRYLDAPGLVALWREGLLARKVLHGHTRGYQRHPQLQRFRDHPTPLRAIDAYLHAVADEADARGYRFDRKTKLGARRQVEVITVSEGQLRYEWRHLMNKLQGRSPQLYAQWHALAGLPTCHPLCALVAGGIADWERIA